ncbi:hypothetical protein MTO96_027010 [Rhipicephalus appendiculatus]
MRDLCPRLARPYLAVLLTLGALACYFIVSEHSRTKAAWHYLIKNKDSQVVSAPREKSLGFSRITFLETGGHGRITARMACAVESAARLNPDWTVYLLSVAHGEEASKDNATSSFAQLLGSIPNVVMGTIKPQEVLQGNSAWAVATLDRCRAKTVKKILGHRCGGVEGFTVMPHWIFMPISAGEWKLHFSANTSRQVWIMSAGSYVIHFYNALSSKTHAVPGCFYREAAELFCHDSLQLSLDINNGVF